MKKILWLGVIFSLLFASHSFAAVTLKATGSGSSITATLTGLTQDKISLIDIYVNTAPNKGTALEENKFPITTQPVNGTATYTFSQFLNTSPIYVKAIVFNSGDDAVSNEVAVTPTTVVVTPTPLTTSLGSGGDINVNGKIDPTANPWMVNGNFTATLVYSTSSSTDSKGALSSPLTGPLSASVSKDNTGTYSWVINGAKLTPSTIYYFQQTITPIITNVPKLDVVNSVNSSVGNVIAPGSAAQSADLNKRSYTLLTGGIPGLSVLPDPDLCAQERAAGQTPQFCDLNDVLNYFLKLMIGLSGVVLVLRLMFEGYQYMVTDVPFLKASAKAGFFSALAGLLLALTSYVILNTINPKLVNESINVQQLSIVDDGDTNSPTIFVSTGQMPKGVYCPGNGKSSSVAAIAQSYKGKVTYSQTNKSALAGADGNAVLDCSSYVNTVLKCAGYTPGKDFINGGTQSIFANTERVSSNNFVISGSDVLVNNKKLNPGDVIGWAPVGTAAGHAIIYIGSINGIPTFMDSHGGTSGRQPGNAIGIYSASQIQSLYSSRITSVERMPV